MRRHGTRREKLRGNEGGKASKQSGVAGRMTRRHEILMMLCQLDVDGCRVANAYNDASEALLGHRDFPSQVATRGFSELN